MSFEPLWCDGHQLSAAPIPRRRAKMQSQHPSETRSQVPPSSGPVAHQDGWPLARAHRDPPRSRRCHAVPT
eukprot:163855-Prymnesium_polylepis.1